MSDFFIFKLCTLEFIKYKMFTFQVRNFTDITMSISLFLIKILPLKINTFKLPNYYIHCLNTYNFRK